jgi:hypothetical protein
MRDFLTQLNRTVQFNCLVEQAAEKVAVASENDPSAAKAGLVFNQIRTGYARCGEVARTLQQPAFFRSL